MIKDARGFSLIELAMAMVIVGVLLVPALSAYKTYMAQEKEAVTEGRMREVSNAINKFVLEYGRYPRPASFAAVAGDAGFGVEGSATPEPCTGAWFASGGMCVTAAPNVAYIGAVPFNVVGLEPKSGLDAWGNHFLYAVTLSQTSAGSFVRWDGSAPFTGFTGNIEVRALDNAVAIPPGVMTTVMRGPDIEYREMVLVSHGADAVGAYTADGQPSGVGCSVAVNEYQDENCNMDHVFVLDKHPGGVTNARPSTRSYVTGGTYYDDYTDDQITPTDGTWAYAIAANDVVWTGGTFIGIGTSDPRVKVDVAGDVTASGKLRSDQMCGGGADCFDPEIITGTLPQMDCSVQSFDGGAVIYLRGGAVGCSAAAEQGSGNAVNGADEAFVFYSSHISWMPCPPGELMVNIDSITGEPVCNTP